MLNENDGRGGKKEGKERDSEERGEREQDPKLA